MTYKIKVGDVLKTGYDNSVRIICVDAKELYPIIGLELAQNNIEYVRYFKLDGTSSLKYSKENLILPEPKTKLVAPIISKNPTTGRWLATTYVNGSVSHLAFFEKCETTKGHIWLEHLATPVPDEEI